MFCTLGWFCIANRVKFIILLNRYVVDSGRQKEKVMTSVAKVSVYCVVLLSIAYGDACCCSIGAAFYWISEVAAFYFLLL